MDAMKDDVYILPQPTMTGKVFPPLVPGIRHHVQPGIIDAGYLGEFFSEMKKIFHPQSVNYDNASYSATRWSISCFMEYHKGVAKDKITLSEELLKLSRPLLDLCDRIYAEWSHLHREVRPDTRFERAQSFITRYRPTGLQTHLPKHIDGGDVDGSFILQLPTDEAFEGGGLTIWDGPGPNESTQYVYDLDVGGVCFLDGQVWHQSNPITSGERWVLVVFYRRCPGSFVPYIDGGKVVDYKTHAARTALGNRLKAALKLMGHQSEPNP
eukprot:EG_transcript_10857